MLSIVKKALAVFLVCAVCLSLCSCSVFNSDIDSLISPPTPSGELGLIKRALNKYVGTEAEMKHPTDGEYLTPIVTRDIDGDGTDEAFAFYSTTEDTKITMHMAFISKKDGKWQVRNDSQISAVGVIRLSFSDLDLDGTLEPIIGWSLYGATDIKLTVHDLSGDVLIQRLEEQCSLFLVVDLDNDRIPNIFTSHLNLADKTAVAKVFTMTETGVAETGSCALDGDISSYSTPVVSTLTDGRPAIYLDAAKGSGMITEVIVFEGEHLKNAFIDAGTTVNSATFRETAVAISDFDGDGIPEIPLMTALPSNDVSSDKEYITRWCSFGGTDLFVKATALMNYTDGYYILVPEKLKSVPFTVTRRVDTKLRTIYLWDTVESRPTDELLRIRTVTAEEWDKNSASRGEYFEVTRNSDTVITAMISSYAGEQAVSVNEVKKIIGFIK